MPKLLLRNLGSSIRGRRSRRRRDCWSTAASSRVDRASMRGRAGHRSRRPHADARLIDCHVHIMASHPLRAQRHAISGFAGDGARRGAASRHAGARLHRGARCRRRRSRHKLAVEQGLFAGPRLFIAAGRSARPAAMAIFASGSTMASLAAAPTC